MTGYQSKKLMAQSRDPVVYDIVKKLRDGDYTIKMLDGEIQYLNHAAADRIEQLEAALEKIAAIEDEHINVPKTEEGAHLWTALAMCVELAERALGEKKDGD